MGLVVLMSHAHAHAEPLFEQSIGGMLVLGAAGWSKPTHIPSGPNYLGLDGTATGVAFGLMGYYQLRVFRYFGLELDVTRGLSNMNRSVKGEPDKYYRHVDVDYWRWAPLAIFNVPLEHGRLSVGLGPEFTLTQSSSGVQQAATSDYTSDLPTHTVKPTYLTGELGYVFRVPGKSIEVPMALRVSQNLSQPDDYRTRTEGGSIRAETSWEVRAVTGIGYVF